MNNKAQLLLVAIISSIITAGSICIYQNKESSKPKAIKKKIHQNEKEDSLELLQEQLSRNTLFLGEASYPKLKNGYVIIVGAGGVGSWAFNMLLRAGVGKIKVIDFDLITLSSLNRHSTATRKQVGISKVEALKNFAKEIMPSTQVLAENVMFEYSKADMLLEGNPDYVLDCIDNIDTKVDLLKYCVQNNIKVISSMGAGAKSDPTRIHIADISNTFEDPLARSVRRKLKLNGIIKGIPTIYSSEKAGLAKLAPLDESKVSSADEYAILPQFRSRILPVLGTLPAMFGMTMASYVLCKIADYPMEPLIIKNRTGMYHTMQNDFLNRERKVYLQNEPIGLSKQHISFILEEIFLSKSAISDSYDKLCLVRFDKTKPSTISNLIVLTKKEAKLHDEAKNVTEVYGSHLQFIQDRLALCKQYLGLENIDF